MVLLHNPLRLILPLIVHYSYYVLADLNLPLVRLQVDVDCVVATNCMTMENFHAPR